MKRKPEKIQACTGFAPLTSSCDTSAALYQLSEQANWEQVVELVHYKPVKG